MRFRVYLSRFSVDNLGRGRRLLRLNLLDAAEAAGLDYNVASYNGPKDELGVPVDNMKLVILWSREEPRQLDQLDRVPGVVRLPLGPLQASASPEAITRAKAALVAAGLSTELVDRATDNRDILDRIIATLRPGSAGVEERFRSVEALFE